MGKGDIKTRRGKIARGTYGVRRLRKSEKKNIPAAAKMVATVKEFEAPAIEEKTVKKVKTVKAAKTENEVKDVKKETKTEKKAKTKKSSKTEKKE